MTVTLDPFPENEGTRVYLDGTYAGYVSSRVKPVGFQAVRFGRLIGPRCATVEAAVDELRKAVQG